MIKSFLRSTVARPLYLLAALSASRSCTAENFDLTKVRKIAILRACGIGDLTLTFPLLRELRYHCPKAEMFLITTREIMPLLSACPYIDGIIPLPDNYKSHNFISKFIQARHFSISELRPHGFDLCLMPASVVDSELMLIQAAFSGSKWNIGFDPEQLSSRKWFEPGALRILTHKFSIGGVQHEAEQTLDILRLMGGTIRSKHLEVWISEAQRKAADSFMTENNLTGSSCVALGIRTSMSRRNWPIDLFERLIRSVIVSFGAKAVIIGSHADLELANHLAEKFPSHAVSAAGIINLGVLPAILERCQAFIGLDSGPTHIAAATGVPVVCISCHPLDGLKDSPAAPERFAPLSNSAIILRPKTSINPCKGECRADRPHCILGVTVSDVGSALLKLLKLQKGSKPNGC